MTQRHPRVVLALLAVLALVVTACSDDASVPESSAADAPLRSPTTTAPPPPILERVALEPAHLAGAGDQRMVAVASGTVPGVGDRLVAIGSSGGSPSVWWSSDGLTWQRPELAPEAFGEGATLADVVADPVSGGFVVVGGIAGAAAVWVSADGVTWTPARVDAGPAMDIVAWTHLGFFAFGTGEVIGAPDSVPAQYTAVWQSPSGERWSSAFDDANLFARPGAGRVVAVVDDGREVQAVVEQEGGGPELWRTSDGLFWSADPDVGAALLPAGGSPAAAAATGLGSTVVVVGTDTKADGVDGALWYSTGSRPFEQVAHDEEMLGGDGIQAMEALVQAGDRLIVVGTETGDDGDVDAVVWTAGTASGVQRPGGPEPVIPGHQHVADIAVLGSTPVVVGWEETASGVDAVVWEVTGAPDPEEPSGPAPGPGTRPQELTWQRVEDQNALTGPGEQRMDGIAGLPDGFVAVGSRPGPDDSVDGAVWRSVDGREWSAVDVGGLGGAGDQRLLDVATGAAGLVAVGVEGPSAAVWTSAEGSAWNRVAHDEGAFGGPGDQRAEAVTALPGARGWLAVGTDGRGDAAVWSSEGTTWTRTPAEGLGGPGEQVLHDVVAGEDGLVAVGTDGNSAAAWTSPDGLAWSRSDLGGGQAAALADSGAVVVVGSAPGDGREGVAWRSAGATTWERVEGGELAGPLDQEMAGVTVGDGVIVAVGTTDLGGGVDAAAWTSADAGTWARSGHDENVFGGDQAQRMVDVAALGTLVVAVGWSGSSAEDRDAGVWVADLSGGSGRSPL